MPDDIPVVLPPVIKFFAASVASPSSPNITVRYRSVIHAEFSCSVVSSLGADYYCTDRVLKDGPSLMKARNTWSAEGFEDPLVIDTLDTSTLDLENRFVRSRSVRAAADSYLYSRCDFGSGDQLVWAFEFHKSGLAEATLDICSHHGRPVLVHFGSHSKLPKRRSGNPDGDWWVVPDASLESKILMRELMRGSRGCMHGILEPLAQKDCIRVRDLVEKETAFCGCGGQI